MSLFRNFSLYSKNVAFIDEDEIKHTYRELEDDFQTYKNLIPERSLILLIAANTYECISFYIYCIKNKIVPILIDSKTDQVFISKIVSKYLPKYIFSEEGLNIGNEYKQINKIKKNKIFISKEIHNHNLSEDLALLLSTSGTTGTNKFVRISYKNLNSNAVAIKKYLNINHNHKTITTLPFAYSYGMSVINSHIYSGGTIVITHFSILQKNFWEIFSRYSITSFAGVPFTYELLKKIDIKNLDSSHFKYSTVAGGNLDLSSLNFFINRFKEIDKKLIVMYGQTEASPRISFLPWSSIEEKKGSIGIAIPGGKIKIEKDCGFDFGELVYFGDNVCLGYAENYTDLSNRDMNQGKLYTGDLAIEDKDGFFYIKGRKKRFIKLFGNRINLDDIEKQIRSYNIDVACIGTDQELKVFIINKTDINIVKEFISKKIMLNSKYYKIRMIESIPKTSSGKIDYKLLQVYD